MFKMKQRNTFSLNEKQNEHKPTKLSITNYHSVLKTHHFKYTAKQQV